MYLICSMGPKINTIADIERLVNAGMTTSRFNFSHSQYSKIEKLIKDIKRNYPSVQIMQDLQGNKLRVSKRFVGEVLIKKGEKVLFCLDDMYINRFKVSKYPLIPINYEGDFLDLLGAREIFMKDATMHFRIIKKDSRFIMAEAVKGGVIREEKGINLPGIDRKRLRISEKDKKDIEWGVKKGVDIICASYVSGKKDIEDVRRCIESYSNIEGFKYPKVWSKIECQEGMDNIDEILKISDGIMLGRGDLKAEVPYYMIPIIQEGLLKKMKNSDKPFVIATYVLESSKKEKMPTIGELNDIYNSIKLGVNGFMLAGEVGTSNNPSFGVEILKDLIEKYTK
ncbi:pyruvate kinase [Clostridium cylindrosporum]|uniref:Pyruvate kinase n=1 Tax=Clostridium cylindrosporum DSM 605 TaxID=1121307 RepID=A0A0J8DF55_CLOCY|nr:pyruvate kinase [Clostridium cylindrosporum]KMT22808.1 pyruvate kinase Pyk [Clostridium cylindrosporum DSM 605]